MKQSKTNRIRAILNPYLKIKAELKPSAPSTLRDYMIKLVTDDTEFSSYLENPDQKLTKAGINIEGIDIPMITNLTKFLRERMSKQHYIVQVTSNSKETRTEYQYNWDSSKSWWWGKESNFFRKRGIYRETEKCSEIGYSKNFARDGVFRRSLLNDDLDLAFFPSQPLITQDLLDKILEVVEESDT